jgi:hypothetical protein
MWFEVALSIDRCSTERLWWWLRLRKGRDGGEEGLTMKPRQVAS